MPYPKSEPGFETVGKGFRIYKSQEKQLATLKKDTSSILVRILIEEYFANRVPSAKIKFIQATKDST